MIWSSFDDLLLLAKGGKVAYMGEMGTSSEKVLSYFSRLAPSDSLHSNPADNVIAAVSSVSADHAQEFFKKSTENEELKTSIKEETTMSDQQMNEAMALMKATTDEVSKRKSALRELAILTKRQLITQWRNPAYAVTRIFCSTLLAV